MSVVRWNPLDEMETMRRQMDRMMEQVLGRGGLPGGLPSLDLSRAFAPNIEVYTTEKDVVVKAELPGIEPDRVEIDLTEDAVHLSGTLEHEEEISEDNYHRSERRYGQFERLIPLPERIKQDDAKATFKNGVLTIRAPLAEPAKKPQARKLKIES